MARRATEAEVQAEVQAEAEAQVQALEATTLLQRPWKRRRIHWRNRPPAKTFLGAAVERGRYPTVAAATGGLKK